jgi:hypothetical protein
MIKYLFIIFLIVSLNSFSQSFTSSISTPNSVICGNRTNTKLVAYPQGPQYTYSWSYSPPNTPPIEINGEVDSTIIVSKVGSYNVRVQNNTGYVSFSSIIISGTPKYTITGLTNNSNVFNINIGDTAMIKINVIGDNSLFSFDYSDGQVTKMISSQSSTYNLKINPSVNKKVVFSNVSSISCGVADKPLGPNFTYEDFAEVFVGNSASLSLISPLTMPNACVNGRIAIPIIKSGNWGNNKSVFISLADQNNNYQTSSNQNFQSNNNSDTIYYDVNSYFTGTGNFKFKLEFTEPYIKNPIFSNYFINITTTGCVIPPARIENFGNDCSGYNLRAFPDFSNGYSYIWKKNGVQIATGNNFSPIQSGNYTVQIINSSTGYNSTSSIFTIIYSNFVGSTSYASTINCNNNSFLNPSFLIPGNTYQWFYSPNENGYTPVEGATNSSLQTTISGNYFLLKKSGNCESRINYLCTLVTNFTSKTACPQSNITISTNFIVNLNIRIQLLDATTNALIYNNWSFNTTPPFGNPGSTFTVMLPDITQVPYGNYKIRIVSSNGQILSLPSQGILTVGAPKPILTASPRYISSFGNNVELKATNCVGNINWSNGFTGIKQTLFISSPQTFSASCNQISNSSCISPRENINVLNNCAFDNYEPNDNKESASQTSTLNFESNPNCLGTGQDKDWFNFINNGQLFYAKVNSSQGNYYPGQYKLKKIIVNNILTLETLPIDLGNSINTEITLFDSSGINQIGYDDNSNPDGFSKIILNLSTLCQTNINLISPLFDIIANENSMIRGNQIKASIKINNLSTSNFRSESSILLNPGFETRLSTAGTFKAEIKNCNNTLP